MVFYKGANAKPLIAERSNIIPTLAKVLEISLQGQAML
jgi:hypothetical protein